MSPFAPAGGSESLARVTALHIGRPGINWALLNVLWLSQWLHRGVQVIFKSGRRFYQPAGTWIRDTSRLFQAPPIHPRR